MISHESQHFRCMFSGSFSSSLTYIRILVNKSEVRVLKNQITCCSERLNRPDSSVIKSDTCIALPWPFFLSGIFTFFVHTFCSSSLGRNILSSWWIGTCFRWLTGSDGGMMSNILISQVLVFGNFRKECLAIFDHIRTLMSIHINPFLDHGKFVT